MIPEHETVDVFIGVDVGKSNHHAVALDRSGKKLLDKALPQDEAKLKTIITSLSRHGRALLVVEHPARPSVHCPSPWPRPPGSGWATCPDWRCAASRTCIPETKSDARDAYIIAEAARTMPHTLRSIQVAELVMLCGFDDDLAKQATATSNRIRGLLTQIRPALERVIGVHLDHQAMPELLATYPTPAALR
ncbi:IS110 family transposase [Arthrobacter rhombi]|uniref:IS110 family transposase n=1 Tax=Arthrobacter rhombi TaxID=71253 RepID=UPI003FD14E37